MTDIDKFYDMQCKKRANILTHSVSISAARNNIYNLGVLTL